MDIAAVATRAAVDGLIISNTTIARPGERRPCCKRGTQPSARQGLPPASVQAPRGLALATRLLLARRP
jgi:dihydroorotate dehydrogenase